MAMIRTLLTHVSRWWGTPRSAAGTTGPTAETTTAPTAAAPAAAASKAAAHQGGPTAEAPQALAVYDEALLECSRTQWQFGDWRSLSQLDRDAMEHHPERARLALLCAAGHAQCGHTDAMRDWVRQAQEWGCPRKLVAQVLISGVQNSLGRAAAVANQPERARLHFERSVRTGMPHSDTALLARARCWQQGGEVGAPFGVLERQEPEKAVRAMRG
ncbi:hypothetical protein [Candidatus Symbiobacter mobilis]|uniref:Methyltransferase FkbM n=1 Tax=Candidatus Symbiobacter mobilis CR TaxID=946483 RepID=U5NA82_9BURK|nr:hypothetical protein [Candidatus Symbiobacter mobilis]AGX88451.1 methyltransferase FkbM [Candidatus Symbiobacter mobilis CR]